MSLSIVHSRAQIGVDAPAVTVEVHLANGLPSLTMVGLPETAVKESKDRVRSAIINSGLQFPARRITLNLAPADLPKDGGRFDLAIALGILSASVQVPALTLDDVECLGELALSGAVRAVRGVLPAALAARKAGRTLLVPRANAEEACLASGLQVIAVDHLLEAVAHFNGHQPIAPYVSDGLMHASKPYPDLSEVQGQLAAKRALLIAAAGAHNLLRLYTNTPTPDLPEPIPPLRRLTNRNQGRADTRTSVMVNAGSRFSRPRVNSAQRALALLGLSTESSDAEQRKAGRSLAPPD